MPKFAQLRTDLGTLDSFELNGEVKLLTVQMFRHHGDVMDGIADSWFIEVVVSMVGVKGKRGKQRATKNSLANHGASKEAVADIARGILLKGTVDLSEWSVELF
jgi:hypothetical protein